MKFKNRIKWCKISIFMAVFLVMSVEGNSQAIFPGIPDKIDKKAEYLFYLHGKIVEDRGIRPTSEKYGVYEYEKILETLKNKGFTVISEARQPRTHPGEYAQKIISQVNRLLQAGVPPANITVVGASKGAFIAMLVSSRLRNKEVNFVFIAGCNNMVFQRFDVDFCGNILSIYDEKDTVAGTCEKFFKNSSGLNKHREIMLKVGTGHGIVYKPLKEWLEPVVKWARGKKLY